MNVLNLSTYDAEGGGGKAAYRMHLRLRELGCKSRMLVLKRGTTDPDVAVPWGGPFGRFWHALSRRRSLRPKRSSGDFRDYYAPVRGIPGLGRHRWIHEADVLVLYWVWNGLVCPEALTGMGSKPLVWRLSDCVPFTGGCTYPGDCTAFETGCHACPAVRETEAGRTASHYAERVRAYTGLELTVVAPSQWIADLARRSRLLGHRRIEVIHTGVNTEVFKPLPRAEACEDLGLPEEGFRVVFCAPNATANVRKGLGTALAVVRGLLGRGIRASLAVAGADEGPVGEGFRVDYLGTLRTEAKLRSFYSCGDVVLAPYQSDNLPNVVLEALACGTCVVANNVGGIPEAIEDGRSGCLVAGNDMEALIATVGVLAHDVRFAQDLRAGARLRAANHFDARRQAARFVEILRSVAAVGSGVQA